MPRNTTASRELVNPDNIVDCKVGADVPLKVLHTFGHSVGHMLKHTVIELVNENPCALGIRKPLKELRIIQHFKIAGIGVDPHTSSRKLSG
jgi:hypothetical protein